MSPGRRCPAVLLPLSHLYWFRTQSVFGVHQESRLSVVSLSFSSPSRHPQTSFLPPCSLQLLAQTFSSKAPSVFATGGWESFRSFESWVYLNGGRSGGEPEAGQVLHKGKGREWNYLSWKGGQGLWLSQALGVGVGLRRSGPSQTPRRPRGTPWCARAVASWNRPSTTSARWTPPTTPSSTAETAPKILKKKETTFP